MLFNVDFLNNHHYYYGPNIINYTTQIESIYSIAYTICTHKGLLCRRRRLQHITTKTRVASKKSPATHSTIINHHDMPDCFAEIRDLLFQ